MNELITLDQLRLFAAVVDEGSFSAAGRRLHRVQSAVSYGIGNLEEALGVSLFDRTGRRPRVTEAGRSLLGDVARVLSAVDGLASHAAGVAQGLEAELSVAVEGLFPAALLANVCKAFYARFPSVPLRLHSGVLSRVPRMVLQRQCSLGISGPVGVSSPELTRRALAGVRMLPVAAPEHPLAGVVGPIGSSMAESQVQIVMSEMRPMDDVGEDLSVLSSHTWRVADAGTKLTLIRAGLGWGTLPESQVADDIAAGTLVQLLLEEWGPGPRIAPLCTVTRRDAPPGPAGRWLQDHLEEACRASELLSGATEMR